MLPVTAPGHPSLWLRRLRLRSGSGGSSNSAAPPPVELGPPCRPQQPWQCSVSVPLTATDLIRCTGRSSLAWPPGNGAPLVSGDPRNSQHCPNRTRPPNDHRLGSGAASGEPLPRTESTVVYLSSPVPRVSPHVSACASASAVPRGLEIITPEPSGFTAACGDAYGSEPTALSYCSQRKRHQLCVFSEKTGLWNTEIRHKSHASSVVRHKLSQNLGEKP